MEVEWDEAKSERNLRERRFDVAYAALVFAVPVTQSNQDDVVKAVVAHGASHVVHFGMWVGTSYGQP